MTTSNDQRTQEEQKKLAAWEFATKRFFSPQRLQQKCQNPTGLNKNQTS